MDKTCLACKNYIPCLIDENSDFHIHDFCKVWHAEIPAMHEHIKFCEGRCPKLTEDGIDIKCKDCQNSADDIEAEIAACWCWEEK